MGLVPTAQKSILLSRPGSGANRGPCRGSGGAGRNGASEPEEELAVARPGFAGEPDEMRSREQGSHNAKKRVRFTSGPQRSLD
ncbi:hypothetical protein MDA_GLEAN10025526 [Myotis davidii]|uniref:Uncharacterized protein n=1 Tax=Myotis davidii TaxID=225400 RepID=L5LMU1_MYODS|nr:hypothetical protein MDA_GLEAN10025526 [Myotis davidii]